MTVKQLIAKLKKIDDPSREVYVSVETGGGCLFTSIGRVLDERKDDPDDSAEAVLVVDAPELWIDEENENEG